MKKKLKYLIFGIVIACFGIYIAFKISPYPYIWLVRYGFNKEAIKVNAELEKYVPEDIESILNIQYDLSDDDAFLDAYYQKDSVKLKTKLPVIVWTHGGGLISGDKNQLSNYCKILASEGYVVVSIDYSIAPEKKYPTPIQQLNKALEFLSENAEKFHIDNSFFVLAGDSGGSMITAATANIITNPNYAKITKVKAGLKPKQLRGLLLYCGIYEIDNLNTDGDFGTFLEKVNWAYFGEKDISKNEYFRSASITNYLSKSFPTSFISAGNNDPLLSQSKLLSSKLSQLNIPIDTLFYPKNHTPKLGHEYQFTLDFYGKVALERSLAFINNLKER